MLTMIDEASYQGAYWTAERLRSAGLKVVAVKATEGTSYVNPLYDWQLGQARAAGCSILHYHVGHAASSSADEFAHFAATARVAPGDLVMLDLEPGFFNVPAPTASAWVENWCLAAQQKWHGVSPVIYTPRVLIEDGATESVRQKLPLFLADPGANPAAPPPPPRPWLISFLQYGERNGTDTDAAYFGTQQQLALLGIPHPPAPAPAPPPPARPTLGQAQAALPVVLAAVTVSGPDVVEAEKILRAYLA